MNLRKIAQGKPCYLRLEGCTHDASQTVLAHVRRGGVAGVGQKPPDVCGFPACDWCHRGGRMTYPEQFVRSSWEMVALWCNWMPEGYWERYYGE